MNLKDAVSSLQLRKKKVLPNILTTVWGENLDSQHILEEYPRPQLERDNWINLNGYWDYAFTVDKAYPSRMEGQILVPFSPESKLSGVERSLQPDEYLWYERTFALQSTQLNTSGKCRLMLHFGAVDQRCAVWCNKKYVCSHHGGYLPFSAEITSFLIEGNNTITVRVQDDTDASCNSRGKQTLTPGGMFYTAQSGIWQTVGMEWVPDIYIDSLRITPLFDESASSKITYEMSVELTFTVSPADISYVILFYSAHNLCSVNLFKS